MVSKYFYKYFPYLFLSISIYEKLFEWLQKINKIGTFECTEIKCPLWTKYVYLY